MGKGCVQGVQARGNNHRETQKISYNTFKIAVIDVKLYTGELILETSPRLKGAFKPYLYSGYSQLYLT